MPLATVKIPIVRNSATNPVLMIAGLIAFLCFSLPVHSKTTLNFALLVINGEQRAVYQEVVDAFESENPDITVNVQVTSNEEYKSAIEARLKSPQYSDVMFWFGGERLKWFIENGWVSPLDELWKQEGWREHYSQSSQSVVNDQSRMYALPVHYYHWGVYYKKSLFKRLGLEVPEDWEAFKAVCQKLKAAKVMPIALGSKEYWPVAGWFDYLNLRLNGFEFHQSLMSGQTSYKDNRVLSTFEYWRELAELGYIMPQHATLTWRDVLPFLYRDLAGMMLMGNFWTSQIPKSLRDDIGVFRFPQIKETVDYYEEAPTDVLFIPSNAVEVDAAKRFLAFMGRQDIQTKLNSRLGMLSPRLDVEASDDPLLSAGRDILGAAQGASQFYDRDNPKPIAVQGMQQMQRFLQSPWALPNVVQELELLRAASFSEVEP